jgi:hypothetical protein
MWMTAAMTIDPANLLKRLEPPVRSPAPGLHAAPLEHLRFDDLLALASSGAIRSGREVTLAFEPTEGALDSGQLDRIAAAADLAESGGARAAAMLVDGRALMIDVPERTITGELSKSAPLHRVDAVVYVPGPDRVTRPLIPGTGLPWRYPGSPDPDPQAR